MAARRVLWSPRLDREITPPALRAIDLYRRRIIGITEFYRLMRRAGFTPSEALIALGEYERAELFWKVIPPPPPPPPPPPELRRLETNLYCIIEQKEKRYYYRRRWIRRKYPKGRFQAWYQHDAYVDPETGEVKTDVEPYPSNIAKMRGDFVEELAEKFYAFIREEDITVGESNITGLDEDLGKPIKKVLIERTVEEAPPGYYPTRTWQESLEKWLK
jgi:hypothetical protein